jgi:GAF domain-containing protein
MSHTLNHLNFKISAKPEQYQQAHSAITSVCDGESNLVANLGNTAAILKELFNWHWVGFYLTEANELILGPFQGPVACTRIAFGKGVCGAAWEQKKSLVVPDVHAFPGHIACSSLSNSEIVVPIVKNSSVVAVLDVDSEHFNHFDETDRLNLEKICSYLAKFF